MATIDVFDLNKAKVDEINLSDEVFNTEVREYLIHEAVKIQLANRRAGTVAENPLNRRGLVELVRVVSGHLIILEVVLLSVLSRRCITSR